MSDALQPLPLPEPEAALTHPPDAARSRLYTQEERIAHGLRALLSRIVALQDQARGGDEEQQLRIIANLQGGLGELAEMVGELLAGLQGTDSELLLAELPSDLALPEAISQLVETTAESLALSSRVVFSGREHVLPAHLARLLYRVAQEALARVSAHEGAHRLRFSIDYRDSELIMGIEDDGVPDGEDLFFPTALDEAAQQPLFLFANQEEQSEQAVGQVMRRLRGMLEVLGGSLTINSSVEQGVQVHVHVPYEVAEQVAELPAPATDQPLIPADTLTKIRVLVVDAQAVSRAGLRHLLTSYRDIEVVGEAADDVQAVSETAELLPQVVLIDTHLPEDQSREVLRQIRQLNAGTRVLLLADQENEAQLYEALRAGINGYILKQSAPDELAQAVRAVAGGEILVQPQLAARLLTRFGGQEHAQENLTAREREVLQLLARGLRNKEIAARLFVSERTVNFHLANIYSKLHVSGRTEALSKALEQGLLKT